MAAAAALLLLAGGGSRRMGRPKALLPVGSSTLIEHVAERLAPGFTEVLVSTGRARSGDVAVVPDALAAGARIVSDRIGAGPLAGIEAGLAATPADAVLAVACDMPYVTAGSAWRLVAAAAGRDAAVPILDGRPEPVFAAYSRSAAAPIAAALAAGELTARRVLAGLDVAWIADLERSELRSLNTPEDYRAFLDALR